MLTNIKVIVQNNITPSSTVKEFLKYFHVGKSKIEEIRVKGKIYINDNISSLDSKLNQKDALSIISEEKEVNTFYDRPLEILYEDDGLIAINKPQGVLVHPDGNAQNTLLNQVAYYLKEKGLPPVVIPLHRIDVDTSGTILFAKNFLYGCAMDSIIERHQIDKDYLFLCHGHLNKKEDTITIEIGKDRHFPNKMTVVKNGITAITKYKVLEERDSCSLVKARIITGKKHQIRVTFAFLGHPLLGDSLYSNDRIRGLKLQSYELKFVHPFSNKEICITSPIREDLLK